MLFAALVPTAVFHAEQTDEICLLQNLACEGAQVAVSQDIATCINLDLYACMHVCMHACMYVCMYVCMNV